MNYYKTSVLTLTLSLLSTPSVFAQCGTISFGPIEAEDLYHQFIRNRNPDLHYRVV